MRRVVPLLFCLVFLLGACAGGGGSGNDENAVGEIEAPGTSAPVAPSPKVATSGLQDAPDFSITTLAGDRFTLSDQEGELPVVLNFWAPW